MEFDRKPYGILKYLRITYEFTYCGQSDGEEGCQFDIAPKKFHWSKFFRHIESAIYTRIKKHQIYAYNDE